MPELFELFVKSLSRENATTPLVIVTGTLLALISLRAGHLAERIRQNVKEALKNNVVDSRFANLKRQNRIFLRRYKWTCGAFILFALALVSISIAGLLVFMEQPDLSDFKKISGTFGLLYVAFSIIGLIIIMKEFIVAPGTLALNNDSLEQLEKTDSAPGADATRDTK